MLFVNTPSSIRVIKHDLKLVQNNVTDSIDLAKTRWSAFQAAWINKMRFTPKEAWKGVKILVGGKESHHVKPVFMILCLPSGDLASNDVQNASVMVPHLSKVYSNHRPVTWEVTNGIEQRYTVPDIDHSIKWEEIKLAIAKLANEKSPGLNDVPPDAFKALSNQNIDILLTFYNTYWKGNIDFDEWNEGRVIPVPKSGDLGDPNKWRGVTLMDMGSKIFSSILCTRLFKIIKLHGVKYQFVSTPGVGCQDGSFTIKTLLRLRHTHNLPTWVLFADLVKAFNTSNHVRNIKVLRRYGCPPNLRSAIERMYKNSIVRLKIGKADTTIPFKVGVKQGDSMAPVLFLYLIMGFAETLEKEWEKNGLHKLQFRSHDNSPQSAGRLTSHPKKYFSEGTPSSHFCMLYVDNGAFAFQSQKELELGSSVIRDQFNKFALQMHVGTPSKASKTEAVIFPQPGFFKLPTPPPPLHSPPHHSHSYPNPHRKAN